MVEALAAEDGTVDAVEDAVDWISGSDEDVVVELLGDAVEGIGVLVLLVDAVGVLELLGDGVEEKDELGLGLELELELELVLLVDVVEAVKELKVLVLGADEAGEVENVVELDRRVALEETD